MDVQKCGHEWHACILMFYRRLWKLDVVETSFVKWISWKMHVGTSLWKSWDWSYMSDLVRIDDCFSWVNDSAKHERLESWMKITLRALGKKYKYEEV